MNRAAWGSATTTSRPTKRAPLGQMPRQRGSREGIAGLLLARAQIGLPLDESRRMGQRYYDITADEVRAAFAKWIRPQDFVQVVRGPAQQPFRGRPAAAGPPLYFWLCDVF